MRNRIDLDMFFKYKPSRFDAFGNFSVLPGISAATAGEHEAICKAKNSSYKNTK